jgi:hypothetical protein
MALVEAQGPSAGVPEAVGISRVQPRFGGHDLRVFRKDGVDLRSGSEYPRYGAAA